MTHHTQRHRVLNRLKLQEAVCGTTLLGDYIPRYAAVIYDLRKEGYLIETRECSRGHEHTTHQIEYVLRAVPDSDPMASQLEPRRPPTQTGATAAAVRMKARRAWTQSAALPNSTALYQLERALRELPELIRGRLGECCVEFAIGEECDLHTEDAYYILELDPVYTTIEAVLTEAIDQAQHQGRVGWAVLENIDPKGNL